MVLIVLNNTAAIQNKQSAPFISTTLTPGKDWHYVRLAL
jgi:hypothetical protein